MLLCVTIQNAKAAQGMAKGIHVFRCRDNLSPATPAFLHPHHPHRNTQICGSFPSRSSLLLAAPFPRLRKPPKGPPHCASSNTASKPNLAQLQSLDSIGLGRSCGWPPSRFQFAPGSDSHTGMDV